MLRRLAAEKPASAQLVLVVDARIYAAEDVAQLIGAAQRVANTTIRLMREVSIELVDGQIAATTAAGGFRGGSHPWAHRRGRPPLARRPSGRPRSPPRRHCPVSCDGK